MSGGQISIFDTSDWKELKKINGGEQKGYVRIALSNGARFVAANPAEGDEPALLVWRTDTEAPPKTLASTDHAFLPTGELVKSLGIVSCVMFHDLENNRDVWPWAAGSLGVQASATPAPGVAIDQAAQPAAAAPGYGAVSPAASQTPPQPQSSSSYGR